MLYLGIDISKNKLDSCLLFDEGRRKRTKIVANSRVGCTELLAWLKRHWPDVPLPQVHVVMEGTGIYHEVAACALHDAGLKVSVINPAHARDFAKALGVHSKTDAIDSQVLALFAQRMIPAAWQRPAEPVRQLQAMLSRRQALQKNLLRERNRQEKALAAGTTQLVQQSLQRSIAFLGQQIDELQSQIDDHIDGHPQFREDAKLLRSIPGVGSKLGALMVALLCAKRFASAEQLAAYLGLAPVQRLSGSSLKGRSRLSKTGPAQVRAMLYLPAVVATRCNAHIKALYERLLKAGKTKMSAIGAAMRKLVHLCFGVWKTRQPYRADWPLNA